MGIELIRENIECEQLLGQNSMDTVVKAEYVIPDTHPDIAKILCVDARPFIISKETMKDKVYLEGQVEYNVIYLAKEEEKMGVNSITYIGKFSNYIEMPGTEHKMNCQCECYVEHMDSNIIHERKIGLEGVIKLRADVYKNYNFDIVKDIEDNFDAQMLKNPMEIDKIVGNVESDMTAKCNIKIPASKPEIGNILKCDVKVRKRDARVLENRVSIEASVLITILYRGKDTRDIVSIVEEVPISKDIEFEGINSLMENYTEFKVDSMQMNIKEDDLGENREVEVESVIKTDTKIMHKEEMDMIEDVYSPSVFMNIKKNNYNLNAIHGQTSTESIVKGDIEVEGPKPIEVVMCSGRVCITDKRIVEDKVIVEGVLNSDILYKTKDEDNYICSVSEEIPFSCPVDVPGCKINMNSIAKAFLENIECDIEAGNIVIKALVKIYVKVDYVMPKEFLVEISQVEGKLPEKKASVTIYIVQPGDTLWKIAKKYSTTVEDLVKINDIENMDYIKPGQKLIIPGRASL
ncbi:DUF3794 domain-containing protein [Clostridium sp. MSJ-11]|uniref:DUF3794 domain-containing protein n=1 Tax=Clostridium mobile TaxID=2841512 RepID=A0ABS6EN18_9CLOT|nr:SPOCS domain-containing protein [Clostridium mobile]MBU5486157.1 DUF3794 domain-containing protein [Clostridium mobile]